MTTSNSHTNIYQLSGLDERERGFTRQVECIHQGNEYHVVFRYERVKVEGRSPINESVALQSLVKTLHATGYSQLRSQFIFQRDKYLGSQELWVDYPDPDRIEEKKPVTLISRLRQWLDIRKQGKHRDNSHRQC